MTCGEQCGGPEQCGHRVYVTYSTFVGQDGYQKFQSKVNFAESEDFGLNYSITKINKTWNQNQGSTIAIDPGVGQPGNKGGPGTIYVAWRHFFDPDAIIVRKSTDYGSKWAKPPVVINNPAMDPFDQPSSLDRLLHQRASHFDRTDSRRLRSTDQGKVFVAWQEEDRDERFAKNRSGAIRQRREKLDLRVRSSTTMGSRSLTTRVLEVIGRTPCADRR